MELLWKTYEYDAWGNVTGQLGTMASANPYRYAGYRYDESTGLYYPMSRYYDPSIGRFINADNASRVKGLIDAFTKNPAHLKTSLTFTPNLYLYCANNSVKSADPFSHNWNFSQPWNSVNNIAFTIDAAIFVIGLAIGLVGATGTIKEIFRKNAKGLILQATKQALLKARLKLASTIISGIPTGLSLFLNLSYDRQQLKYGIDLIFIKIMES